ncbi:hypothetical protein AB1N83_008549 [Pleurotus pulmonarius]
MAVIEWASKTQYNFLSKYISSYAQTEPGSDEREEFREQVHADWQKRWSLDAHQKKMIQTYFKNHTRPRKYPERRSHRTYTFRSTGSPEGEADEGGVDKLEEEKVDELENEEVDELEEEQVDELEEEEVDELEEAKVDELEEAKVDELEEAKVDELEEAKVMSGGANKAIQDSSKPPRMRRYHGMEDIILDTDLSGFSAEDVQLTFEDGLLVLVAAKPATDGRPARQSSGNYRVRKGMRLTFCGMEKGILRLIFAPDGKSMERPTLGEGQIVIQKTTRGEYM